ncbi:MAG: TonB-dependent receptor [Gammaproteobacteria bacterium]|nr:TonB-dependent receptor [Gammaproteobacteria bacterium]
MKKIIFYVFLLFSYGADAQNDFIEEVIVSSVGARAADDIISSTDIVEHEGLDRNINRNLGQILENIPGISSAGFGRAVGRPVIRGLGDYRVQVLENDLGAGDVASAGPDHPHAQNALAISKMEILKGPSTLRFGPYATSGVVNMLSEHKLLTDESESGGDLIYGYSSVAKEDAFHWHTLRRAGDWFFGFSGHSRDADDYKIPGFEESNAYHEAEEAKEAEEEGHEEHARISGKAKGTALDEKGINLHSTFLGDRLKTTFFFNTNKSLFGVPAHEHHEEDEGEHEEKGAETVQLDMKRDRFGFELNQVLSGNFQNILFSSSFTDYSHKELEDKKVGTEFDNNSFNLRAEITHSLLSDQSGLFGFSHYDEDFSIQGAEKYLPSFKSYKSAIFAVQNYENNQILLESAARIDRVSLDPEGNLTSYSDTASSFSIGGGYKPIDDALFGLSLARNERSPSSAELYANGPHIGPQVYEVGSFNSTGALLDKETATASELYFRYNGDNWLINSSVYFNQFNNFVYGDFSGAKKDGLPIINYKQQDASITGIEVQLEYFSGQIGIFDINHEFSFSHIHAELNSGKNIPRIPPSTYQYSLEGVSGNMMWLCRLRHAGKQNDIAINELATDSYTQFDVEVSWIPTQLEGFTFSLIARNIGDEEIRNHTSYLKDRLSEPGRNINLTVQYSF